MEALSKKEAFAQEEVTYTLEAGGRVVIIERVPARVSLETGERFFSPETVERLQRIVWEERTPKRVVETPVYDFAEPVV